MFHVELRTAFSRLVSVYQASVSPDSGILAGSVAGHCPFYPTCSDYARQAVARRGIVMGSAMAIWRVLRCHPGRKPTFDPVK